MRDGSTTTYEVTCPHCHRDFAAALLAGQAARYRGFKCPHCKLFVPYERAEDREEVAPTERK